MLTDFEMNEAKSLAERINSSFHQFILDVGLADDIDRLDYLQSKCEHNFQNDKCIYCGKEID